MKRRGIILVLLCGVVGCNARQTSTTTNAVAPVAAVFANQGEWVSSQDKSLSLRVSTDKATYRVGEAVRIQIEVRNKSQEAIRLPSLEDEAFPWITGSKEIKYIGPQVDRTPEPEIVLNPGVSGTREVVISGENWGRLDLPGKYVAHFLYQGPSSGIYRGLESSVGFSVEKEQSGSPLVTNAVSVSVAGYFTTNINGRTAVRATIKMTNQSSRLLATLVPMKTEFTLGGPVTVRFDVKNVSKEPVSLWSRNHCSWGHEVYHFEITMPDGSVVKAEEPPTAWNKNFPHVQKLAPGKTFSVEFDLMRLTAGPLPAGEIRVRGIYRSAGLDAKEPDWVRKNAAGLWIGETATDPIKIVLKPTPGQQANPEPKKATLGHIKAEVEGLLVWKDSRYRVIVRPQENPKKELVLVLNITEQKVLVRQLEQLQNKQVVVTGEIVWVPKGSQIKSDDDYTLGFEQFEIMKAEVALVV